jgi:diguanylate cyclase (GGDEF)-like protein
MWRVRQEQAHPMSTLTTGTTSDSTLQQALTSLQLVNEIAAEGSGSSDRRRVAAVLHRHAQLLLDLEDALLIVRDPAGGLRLVIPETEREVSGSDVPATRLFSGGLVTECMRARTIRILRDTSGACRVPLAPFERTLISRGARALAAAPLIGRGVVYGTVLFWALDASAFHQETRRSIAMVLPHVVNALMMASLLEQVEARSATAQLTGLANRRWFDQRLDEELDRVRRYRRPLCLALLDPDRLEWVNSRLGRAAGDDVLRQLAALLLTERRSTDLVCRYGSEGLAMILPETEPGAAVELAERIRARAAAGALGRHDDGAPVTVSIGLAGSGPLRDRPSTLFAAANDALHQARSAGRHRVRLASDPIVDAGALARTDRGEDSHTPATRIEQRLT